uniref:3-deoxy-7-phosphoheptulonate synthase n=1 Tax=Gongylonema pulchrum TaxID=637853 RepID=A0A183EIF5_9BILA
LVQMAPQYYDMSTFPDCDAKRKLQHTISALQALRAARGL